MTERPKIWILEDSPLEGELVRRALATAHDVDLFADGSVLLERATSASMPDAIVLDWRLPGISGLEVARVLRASHDAMTLPLLMLTGQGHREDILEALAAGANDYITKPYDMAEVLARVGTLVRASRLHRAQTQRARQLALSAEIGATLATSASLAEIAERFTLALLTHLDATAVEAWFRREGRLELLAAHVHPEWRIPREAIDEVQRTHRMVTAAPAGPARPSAQGFAAIPLMVRDDFAGVVAVCVPQPLEEAMAVLTTVADLLSVAVSRSRIEEERFTLLARERNSRAEAEAANRSKDEFLAMVSHELRTPLNAITGWTSMLLRGNLDPEREKRALETIERNARSQAQLIDDLLDIGRITSGKLRLEASTVDVRSIAEMAFESVRLAAESKGIALENTIDPHVGQLKGDADRVQQIIWNLLSNAIKFTPKGGRVVLRVARNESGVEISVEDTGVGIAAEFLPYIFDRFRQADSSATRAKGGLGLGLAIVKHLVELHGGTIDAHSPGASLGSTFRVLLPTTGSDGARPAGRGDALSSTRPPFEPPREVEGMRVLVLDDDEDARELIRSMLEACKIDVITASSAAEAFTVVASRNVDVVLSDIAMPVEDGLSFIRRVRALPRERGGSVPAIALTAYARLEDRTTALRAGFNNHVAKPVEPSELLAVISSLATL